MTCGHVALAQWDADFTSEDQSKPEERIAIVVGNVLPCRDDDGLFSRKDFQYRLKKHLNQSRKKGPLRFLEFLGYLYLDRKTDLNFVVEQKTVNLAWFSRPGEIKDLKDEFTRMETGIGKGDENISDVNRMNE